MTVDEKILWDYIDEESNELVLKMKSLIVEDGFDAALSGDKVSVESLALKILSAAMVKTLAIMCEEIKHPNIALAYMQMAPMHVELLKAHTLKGMGR